MNSEKIIVKTLYRGSLKICRDLGFKYGSRNKKMVLDFSNGPITSRMLRRMEKRKTLGEFLGNNLIYQYQEGTKDIEGNIDDNIDDAFEGYRYLNAIRYEINGIKN